MRNYTKIAFCSIIVCLLFLFVSKLFAVNSRISINKITSSTSFSQELSALSPNIETITAKQIRLYGVENIPELLNLISGITVYRVNGATSEISIRGLTPVLRINPLILLDGMEIADQFYNRNYLYNLPVTIDDIDKIEIIKNSSEFSNGYLSPGGIINIVTKQAQYLSNNHAEAIYGSNNLDNFNFSINRYDFSTYWKLTGRYRAVNDYNSNRRINKSKMLNLSVDKYFNNSKLFVKGAISEQDLEFVENYTAGLNHKEISFKVGEELNNTFIKNFLINYKRPDFDATFYYQGISGRGLVRLKKDLVNGKFINEYYKFSLRYSFENLLTGVEYRYYYVTAKQVDSNYKNILSGFIEYNSNFLNNFTIEALLRNDFVRNNGSNFNYKLNIGYASDDKSFNINAGYMRSIKLPNLFSQYTNYDSVILKENINLPFVNFDIPVSIHANKDLNPVKIYTTDLSVSKKWNKFLMKTTFFYNRIVNNINMIGSLKLVNFKPMANIYSENFMNFVIHGFESKINFIPNKRINLFISYMQQQMKNKTFDKTGNFFLPEYKITCGILFDFPVADGSVTSSYIPAIKSRENGRSDYIFSLNANLIKKLLDNKLELSISGRNLFTNNKKEIYFGESIDTTFYFKIKYKF